MCRGVGVLCPRVRCQSHLCVSLRRLCILATGQTPCILKQKVKKKTTEGLAQQSFDFHKEIHVFPPRLREDQEVTTPIAISRPPQLREVRQARSTGCTNPRSTRLNLFSRSHLVPLRSWTRQPLLSTRSLVNALPLHDRQILPLTQTEGSSHAC